MGDLETETTTPLDVRLDRRRDLAAKYRATQSDAATIIPAETTDKDLMAIEENGYVIIEGLYDAAEMQIIKEEALALLGHTGRNSFEGLSTQRLYASLQKTRVFDRLVDHPRILALLDRMFEPNYLLSQCQVINILPGEAAQALHRDDLFVPISKAGVEIGAATVWAIDDFTETNGSTVVVPESHHWSGDRMAGENESTLPAVMPAGSVIFYPSSLWHGGGANRSSAARMVLTCQYCQPYMRQQENYSLSLSKDVVKEVSEDIRRMLGYSIHPPFIGMVNGMHPKRLLED